MRSHALLLLLAAATATITVGCVPRATSPAAVRAETIPHNASPGAATLAATEGLEDAGLDVSSHGPSLSTAWRTSAPMGTRLAPSRRVAIRVRIDPNAIVVRPIAEECDEAGCMPVASLLPEEALLVSRAVDAIRERVAVIDGIANPEIRAVDRAAIERQATRDDAPIPPPPRELAPPTGRGPIAVPTRMGPTEVSAGWQVDAVLVNGALVSGRVMGVSADGIAIELAPGREVTLWAGDLASIRVR